MENNYGCQSMVRKMRRVLVKRPDQGFAVENWRKWHYSGPIDLEEAQKEHDEFSQILRKEGIEVLYHPEEQPDHADSIFTYDPAIITNEGSVIFQMGKKLRQGEEIPMARRLTQLGIPTLYRVHGEASIEGGDTLWLDEDTIAIGQGFRTNKEGRDQMKEAMKNIGVKVIPVELPYFYGPEACLHIMPLISFIDHELAVVYPPLIPVPFWKELKNRGIDLIEVPENEFNAMGTNILALEPKKCLMLEKIPITQANLKNAGCKILTYKGAEISLKAEGGPCCLTRPIWRD